MQTVMSFRSWVRAGVDRAGVQSQTGWMIFRGKSYGRLEESADDRVDRCGGNSVHEKEISGGRAGDRSWSGSAGGGISGEVRKSAAVAAGLFRARHAGDGNGCASRKTNYRCGGAKRGGSLGRIRRIGKSRPWTAGLNFRLGTVGSDLGLKSEVRPSLDAELFSGVGTEALGGPGRSPHYIYRAVADARQLLDA